MWPNKESWKCCSHIQRAFNSIFWSNPPFFNSQAVLHYSSPIPVLLGGICHHHFHLCMKKNSALNQCLKVCAHVLVTLTDTNANDCTMPTPSYVTVPKWQTPASHPDKDQSVCVATQNLKCLYLIKMSYRAWELSLKPLNSLLKSQVILFAIKFWSK